MRTLTPTLHTKAVPAPKLPDLMPMLMAQCAERDRLADQEAIRAQIIPQGPLSGLELDHHVQRLAQLQARLNGRAW